MRYEGFGIPPLEAIACTTPVITSATSSLPEVVDDATILVDPTATGEISAALRRVLADEALRRRLAAAGAARAACFSLPETARQTLALYQAALSRPGNSAPGRR